MLLEKLRILWMKHTRRVLRVAKEPNRPGAAAKFSAWRERRSKRPWLSSTAARANARGKKWNIPFLQPDTYHVYMISFRISVLVLAMIHAIFAGFTAVVGAFANGGGVWERLLVILLHPLGAAGVLPTRVVAPPDHEEDPCHSGAPDGERNRHA